MTQRKIASSTFLAWRVTDWTNCDCGASAPLPAAFNAFRMIGVTRAVHLLVPWRASQSEAIGLGRNCLGRVRRVPSALLA